MCVVCERGGELFSLPLHEVNRNYAEMSAQEIGPRTGYGPHDPSPSSPPSLPQTTTTSNGMGSPTTAFVNIGEFVASYNIMIELIQPLRLVGGTLLRILR